MKAERLISVLACVLLLASGDQSNDEVLAEKQTKSDDRSYQTPQRRYGGWQDMVSDVAGGIFLGAQKGVLFYAYDILSYPKERVELVARVQLARLFRDVPGVMVSFYDGSKLIGKALTDEQGRAVVWWEPGKVGNYSLKAKIDDVPNKEYADLLEIEAAPLLVAVREKKTAFVVIDLDHTVVASSFFRVLLGGAKPMPDSVRVSRAIAKKYGIIYLTQRPELLSRKSKDWLSEQGYPQGPLLLSELKEALAGSGKFKSSELALMRKRFGGIGIGIGDKPSDAQAYVDNGMKAYLLPHYKARAKDMRKMAKAIRGLRGQGRLQVVKNWKQIEAGIFRGETFGAEDFVKYLHERAEQLEYEKKLRKEEEEKDDDDDDD